MAREHTSLGNGSAQSEPRLGLVEESKKRRFSKAVLMKKAVAVSVLALGFGGVGFQSTGVAVCDPRIKSLGA